jgi:hypothetical protein
MLAEVITARTPPLAAVRRILAACWPLLLPAVPMVVWRAESTGAAMSLGTFAFKVTFLVSTLRTKWHEADIGALAIITVVIVGTSLARRSFDVDLRLRIAALLCFALYCVMPTRVFGSAFADMRLLPYAFALALLAVAPARLSARGAQMVSVLALVFCLGRLGITGAAYVAHDRVVQTELGALDKLPMGARVAFFEVNPCRVTWAVPILDHLGAVAIARRNAFVNDQWQAPGVNPLIVSYPAAEPFVHDPSHLVQNENCGHAVRPTVSQALAKVPLDAFTHVWIVGAVPERFTRPARLVRVLYPGKGHLYAVGPAAVPGAPKSR